jgi:hypothetical protein
MARGTDHAFQALKSKLITQTVLQYADSLKKFILMDDDSNSGLRVVLSQENNGNDLPIAYASYSLNKAAISYTKGEKELFAPIWAIHCFRLYLYGLWEQPTVNRALANHKLATNQC